MPQQGITFQGAYIGLPGAYYADNVSAGAPVAPPVTPPLLFIGYGWGPAPNTPVTFTNPQDLLNALRGAPASDFVQFLANPSPQLNGAQRITFIDASTNTQSTAALLNSGAATYALLTSTLYGPPSNRLQYQVSAPSAGHGTGVPNASGVANAGAGAKAFNLTIVDNYAGREIVGANLTTPFQLAYQGSQFAAGSGVTVTGLVSYTASGTVSGGTYFAVNSVVSGESFTFSTASGGYTTIAQLVQAINGTGIFYADLLSSSNGQLPASGLTQVSGAPLYVPSGSVSGIVTTFPIPVRAYLNDPAYWVNQFASAYCTATVSGSAADTAASMPVTGGLTYFSGAYGGPPTLGTYATALNVGLSTPAWAVVLDSNITGVAALLAQHCETASSPPYGMWRRGFTGSSIGDSVATTDANALALDSFQVCYVYPGVYRSPSAGGAAVLYGGLYAAAAAAAMATGNNVNIPLTNKVINGTGVEAPGGVALTSSQIVALQNNGVMVLFQPTQTNVPTILSDITTWQADANVENTSSQQVACRYWLAYSVVNVLSPYVGTIAAPANESNIVRALTTLLNALVYTNSGSSGVLASWQKGSIRLTYNGQQQLASVTFNATLVGQNRYITCLASILPLNFTITATG